MTISDRFVLFMRELDINQKTLIEQFDLSRTRLSNFINGVTESPKIDLLVGLATHYPQLNLHWLLVGEGEMWREGFAKPNEDEAPKKGGLQIIGPAVDNSVTNQLMSIKDELIYTQRKQIELLERENKELRNK